MTYEEYRAKVKNEIVEKIIDTMANNKADMIATAPALNDFSLDTMYRKHDMTYHPGALKYFQDHKIEAITYMAYRPQPAEQVPFWKKTWLIKVNDLVCGVGDYFLVVG